MRYLLKILFIKTTVLLTALLIFSLMNLLPEIIFWITGISLVFLLSLKYWEKLHILFKSLNYIYWIFLIYGTYVLGYGLILTFLLTDIMLIYLLRNYQKKLFSKTIYALYIVMAFISGGWNISHLNFFTGTGLSLIMLSLFIFTTPKQK